MPPKGKRFSKEYQPENNGRKKNKLKDLIKESQFSSQDIRAIFANIIAVKTLPEIEDMLLDDDTDFMIKAYLKAMVSDFRQGKTDTIDKLVEYAFGRARTVVENKTVINNLDINSLTKEEREAIKAEGLILMEEEKKKK